MKNVEDFDDLWHSVLKESLNRLSENTSAVFAEGIAVLWNKRLRSTAGRAFWLESRIELNPRLLEIGMEEVQRTLLHELAHLLAHYRNASKRIAPHGVEWRNACIDLGIPNEKATHRLPLPYRKQKTKWLYLCNNCGISINRVRKIKRSVACYSCCKKYSSGNYDRSYLLVEKKVVDRGVLK